MKAAQSKSGFATALRLGFAGQRQANLTPTFSARCAHGGSCGVDMHLDAGPECHAAGDGGTKAIGCCGGPGKCRKAVVAIVATVLAAFAISYLAHLSKTGAGVSFGLLATLSIAGAACTLQDMLVAVPFGILVWIGAPPSTRCERPRSVCLLAFAFDLRLFASAAMGSTHHLGSLYLDRSHAALSLLFFAVLWAYLFYVLRAVFCGFSKFAAGLFCAELPDDGSECGWASSGADEPLQCDGEVQEGADTAPEISGSSSGRIGKTHALRECCGAGRTKPSAALGSNARIFLISFAVLLIAWSPYVISMAPGSDCPDMGWQIAQFVCGNYSSHHPLYATFVYGAVFSLGNAIAGVDAGLLAMMLFQTLALALALSLEVVELAKMRFARPALAAALLFFAVVPVFGSYCQWIVKDSLFGACFALYATVYIRCCLRAEGEGPAARDLALLLGVSVPTGLLRNNAFYAVAFAAVAFALVFRKRLGAVKLALLLAVVPLTVALNQAALVATGAQKGDLREALSIPFQQTARCAAEHPDDVSRAEKRAIDAVLDYSDLATRYRWNISDPVKGKAKTGDKAALAEYFKVWAAQGLRHPVCYIDSFLDQSFGYWSLADPAIYGREYAGFGNQWVGQSVGTATRAFFPKLAAKAQQVVEVFRNMPLLSLFSISGFYTLAGLMLATLALYRGRPRALILLAPSAVLLLTCMAGPLNGSIRYSFGNIAAFPVVAGAVVFALCGRKGGPSSS